MREGERADQFRIAAAFVLILEVEGRGEGRASTRITRPRFLRNLTEISLAAPLPSYPETKRTFSKRGGGGGRVTCGRGKQLFDSWLEHLSREIYVVRGGEGQR